MRASRIRERQAVEDAKKQVRVDERRQRRAFIEAVNEIAQALGEVEPRSKATIERSVAVLGIEAAQALRHEVEALEAQGGMLTVDGARRRTPGGVYMYILKQRMNEAGRNEELKQILTG
jgi:hypothetical protein